MPNRAAPDAPTPAWPLDPFGVWDAWARTLELHAPLSGAVNQAIEASLARSLGQLGVINISTTRSADPELERRIVEEVAGYGRQLGWVVDALAVLIDARRGRAPGADDERALDQALQLRAQVEALKQQAAADRVERLVADVRRLRREPDANAEVLAALRAALDGD
jgi:SepF-like predicted cell division protein (DUF552 family)